MQDSDNVDAFVQPFGVFQMLGLIWFSYWTAVAVHVKSKEVEKVVDSTQHPSEDNKPEQPTKLTDQPSKEGQLDEHTKPTNKSPEKSNKSKREMLLEAYHV